MIQKEFEYILFDQLNGLSYQYDWLDDKVYILCKDFQFSEIIKVLKKISINNFETCRVFNNYFEISISFNHSFIDKNYLLSIKGIQKYNL